MGCLIARAHRRYAEGKLDRLAALAAELVRLKVDSRRHGANLEVRL
jgi:hypothetical protein